MNESELLRKLSNIKRKPDLDALRSETALAMQGGDEETFNRVQGAFRKALNRVKRVPIMERDW